MGPQKSFFFWLSWKPILCAQSNFSLALFSCCIVSSSCFSVQPWLKYILNNSGPMWRGARPWLWPYPNTPPTPFHLDPLLSLCFAHSCSGIGCLNAWWDRGVRHGCRSTWPFKHIFQGTHPTEGYENSVISMYYNPFLDKKQEIIMISLLISQKPTSWLANHTLSLLICAQQYCMAYDTLKSIRDVAVVGTAPLNSGQTGRAGAWVANDFVAYKAGLTLLAGEEAGFFSIWWGLPQ